MFPKRNVPEERSDTISWDDLGYGAPTIIGLAKLCGNALASGECSSDDLSLEAKAILYAARERGVIEIKASNNAFDAVDRFLAIFVEFDPDRGIMFRRKRDPQRTIRFLDAFRELCQCGLVIHHLYREFSLTTRGFELAGTIKREHVEESLDFGVELDRHEW